VGVPKCQTLIQAPVPAQVIDKGIPTAGLLAQVMVAEYADHLPLYRQEAIFGRTGLAIPRSTLGTWVGACGVRLQPLVDALKHAILAHRVPHAGETPVTMLKPGTGKTHRAYLWAYTPGAFEGMKAVVYDFADSRAGQHAQDFLGEWRGALVCDDYSGYKALLAKGIVEAGCLAHARRKFVELHTANKSQIAEAGIQYFARLYEIEREVKDLGSDERQRIRQARGRPIAEALHAWMIAQRLKVPGGSGTAKALNYSLKRWTALTRYLDDGILPPDNNRVENQIRPIAVGRGNWLFAGSLRAGQRAAAIMSLIQSAKLNGHAAYAYLKDVFLRLPTQPHSPSTNCCHITGGQTLRRDRRRERLPYHWPLRGHRLAVRRDRQRTTKIESECAHDLPPDVPRCAMASRINAVTRASRRGACTSHERVHRPRAGRAVVCSIPRLLRTAKPSIGHRAFEWRHSNARALPRHQALEWLCSRGLPATAHRQRSTMGCSIRRSASG